MPNSERHFANCYQAIVNRRAARNFSSKKVNDQLLYELLDLTNRAPSGFNLQPWHFIVVRDPTLKTLLAHAALDQRQIIEAPVCIVFVADPDAWKQPYKRMLEESIRQRIISVEYAQFCEQMVKSFFELGPLGAGGVLKRITAPIRRFIRPTANSITSKLEASQYMKQHTMLAAATFMIAASGAGLATCPMEGFDEERVKKLLAIPKSKAVPVLVPVGYEVEGGEVPSSYRFPIAEKLSVDLYPNMLQKIRKPR